MLTETTVSKLREMRLSVMANELKDQFADPQFQSMAFEDRLGLLVDAEWNARKNNHLNKLIRQATLSDPGACLENVEYLPDRGLKQEELLRFGTCNYIQEHHNIILLGATGSGKTYLACALGMAAARQFYAVKYIRLPDLLVEFQIARGNGTIRKLMAQYRKYGGFHNSLFLGIDEIVQDSFICPVPNAVHPGDPFHLILCFQSFRNALLLGQLRNKVLFHFLRLAVNFFQMGIQRVLHKRDGIKCLTVFP